jgi:hypothetical protein
MKSFTKTVTTTYEPLWVHFPFIVYDEQFMSIREDFEYKCDGCFKCGHGFKLSEQVGLTCSKEIGNKVLCELCSKEIS